MYPMYTSKADVFKLTCRKLNMFVAMPGVGSSGDSCGSHYYVNVGS